MPEGQASPNGRSTEKLIALFIDFENLALGIKQAPGHAFKIQLVLERLLEKGRIVVKKAYCDWTRYREYRQQFHEAAIELIEIPKRTLSGKNSADIRMVVDVMDLAAAKEHIDTFGLVTGDSDFSPLVSKLKENNKEVIGCGIKAASSELLIENCDEFIFYDDLLRLSQQSKDVEVASSGKEHDLPQKKREAFKIIADGLLGLLRENKDTIWASMLKQTIKRKRPQFDESYFGYRTFTVLLEDAERHGIVRLEKDKKSGSYQVLGFGDSP
jgi:uncharacterized protein (TIGR00288 family)